MNVFKYIAILKNFGQRSMQYITYMNSLLIISTFLTVKGYNIPIYFVLMILVILVVIVGYLDYRFILEEELKHINRRNDIKQDLGKIKKYLDIK